MKSYNHLCPENIVCSEIINKMNGAQPFFLDSLSVISTNDCCTLLLICLGKLEF